MRFVRLAMCVAAFAVVGGVVLSEDIDVRSLQQKLAAQEARLNDLQAKVNSGAYASGSDVEGLVSINKNAVVTVGGTVNTRYFYRNVRMSGGDVVNPDGDVIATPLENANGHKPRYSGGDLTISDAKLRVKADVNEYFDAYLQVDLQSSNDGSGSDNAEIYWARWKNVCNSGFGLKVGRDVLTFGEGTPIGVLATYAAGQGDGANAITGNAIPHANWDEGRYTQITPYWESQDGKFGAELSLYQDYSQHSKFNGGHQMYMNDNYYKSRNYGFGSMSARFRFRPIEGLLLSASVFNFRDNAAASDGKSTIANLRGLANWLGEVTGEAVANTTEEMTKAIGGRSWTTKKNSTAIDLAFAYRPAAFNRLNVWGQWIHGWNVDNYADLDSDAVNLGASFDINESLTFFAMGDYMRVKGLSRNVIYGNNVENGGGFGGMDKYTSWAGYVGMKYVLPYGVALEVGWKHEQGKMQNQRVWDNPGTNKMKDVKVKADTIYAHLGFDF